MLRLIPFTLLPVVLLGATFGCGSGSPYTYQKVEGRISYEDGTPLPGSVVLRFVAQDAPTVAGAVPRPAMANADAQGRFDCVTSYKYGDGLIKGKHKVAIEVSPDAKPIVPKEYTNAATSPLIIDTANTPLEIKVPKPKATR